MQKHEFGPAMAYLAASCGLYRDDDRDVVPRAVMEAYWDLLGDLPADAFREACRLAALRHEFSTLPTAGLLRRVTADLLCPRRSAGDAWGGVAEFARKLRPEQPDEYRRLVATVPDDVAEVVRQVGGWSVVQSGNPDVVRSNFLKLWNERTVEIQGERLCPPKLAESMRRLRAAEAERRANQSPDVRRALNTLVRVFDPEKGGAE